MGTLVAEKRSTNGGVSPGGSTLSTVWLMAVVSATAASIDASGWKKTRITPAPIPAPLSDCDSMCSMALTVVVMARSEMVTTRPSISFADSPLYSQMTETTGMLMLGKMSVGVRAIVSAPRMPIRSASTAKV